MALVEGSDPLGPQEKRQNGRFLFRSSFLPATRINLPHPRTGVCITAGSSSASSLRRFGACRPPPASPEVPHCTIHRIQHRKTGNICHQPLVVFGIATAYRAQSHRAVAARRAGQVKRVKQRALRAQVRTARAGSMCACIAADPTFRRSPQQVLVEGRGPASSVNDSGVG